MNENTSSASEAQANAARRAALPNRAEIREARPIRNRDRGELRRRSDLARREAELLAELEKRMTPSQKQARAALGRD